MIKNAINSLDEKDKNYILNYEPCVNLGFIGMKVRNIILKIL